MMTKRRALELETMEKSVQNDRMQERSAFESTGYAEGGKSGFAPHPQMAALQNAANLSPQVQQMKTMQRKVNASGPQQVAQMKAASINNKSGKLENFSDAATKNGIANTSAAFKADTLTSTGEDVGVAMVADCIGPDHPEGSGPDNAVAKKHITSLSKNDTFIRGHLLNGDLGGPGDTANLFPITAQANSLHYQQVEKQAKSLVNDQKAYARYEVNVINRDDDKGIADFVCSLSPIDANKKPTIWELNSIIHSEPGKSSAKTKTTQLGNKSAVVKEGKLGDDDIEYQSGKIAKGWLEIDDSIMNQMAIDAGKNTISKYGGNDFEMKMKAFNCSSKAIENVWLFVQTQDDSVTKNTNKGTWNGWVKFLNANYA
jgi:hypothetical protein